MGETVLSLVFLYAVLFSSQTSMPPETRPSQASAAGRSGSTLTNPGDPKITTGTEIKATLDTPLSTRTAQPGDLFTATITEPIRTANGDILVPAGSRLQGEVSESAKTPDLAGKNKLSLRFSSIQIADGSSITLSARLISLEHMKDKASASSGQEVESGKTETTIAKNSGADRRAAGRLVLGSALKGLAIGPLAGGGYVLAANGKDVALPAQTRLTLRVDHDLFVSSHVEAR